MTVYTAIQTRVMYRFVLVLPPTPSECPVEGQEYFDGVNKCVPCTGTCEEPEVACLAVCRSGCGCPVGTVLDEEANACVHLTDCPKGKSHDSHMTVTLPPCESLTLGQVSNSPIPPLSHLCRMSG